MPELLKINKIGDFGVNTDLAATELSPEYFTSGINFRLRDSQIETYNGGHLFGTAPTALNIRKAFSWVRAEGNKYIVMGTHGVYTFDGKTWINVTPAGFPTSINSTFEWSWSACQSGISIVISNPQIGPYYLNDGVTIFTPLPYKSGQSWQQKGSAPFIIRSHKEFLIALGTRKIDGTSEDANVVAWSAPATGSGIPFTWDPSDLSTIAGELYLAGQGGFIIDGLTLRDEFCIYSKGAIDFMRYVGGDLIWNVRSLSSETGLLNLNGVTEIYDRHIMLTKNDILMNDGNSLTSIIDKKIRRRVFGSINKDTYERSFVVVNDTDKEVWICIPDEAYLYPNVAVIYSWESNHVSVRNTIPNCVDGCPGPLLSTISKWSDVTDLWDSTITSWNTDNSSAYDETFVIFDNGVSVYNALDNNESINGGFNTLLERNSVSLGGYGVSCTTVAIFPHIRCSGDVNIRMGASLSPEQGVQWKQAQVFTPKTMRKLDIRTTGPYHSWRIESVGNTPFVLSGMDIVYEVNGAR